MSSLKPDRRDQIIEKISLRTEIIDNGFVVGDKPSPCFIWKGPTSGDGRGGGYGRMALDGQTVAVHIVSYTHFFGFIPGKKQVDHLCNHRRCWNPAHLDLVTHKQNQKRRDQRLKEKS